MLEVLLFFVLAVIIGIMFAFFGYPFFRVLLPVWGFFAGLSLGFQGIMSIMGPGFLSTSMGLIIGFFIGIILAAIAWFAYEFAIYLFGATVGYVLGAGFMMALGFDRGLLTFGVGIAAAVGLTMLFAMTQMPKFLIILLTASAGAMAMLTGLFALFGQVPTLAASLDLTRYMVWGSWFWILIWAFLAGFGMAFQYAVSSESEDLNKPFNAQTAKK
jgi:hypothetical protein